MCEFRFELCRNFFSELNFYISDLFCFFKSKTILFSTCALFAIFYCILFVNVVIQFLSDSTLNWGFCFTNKCLEVVDLNFKYMIYLTKEVTVFFALCLTAIGVRTGLHTYKLSLENSMMNNHNTNLKVFIDFCNVEVNKHELLEASKINYYNLYNKFYPFSREGRFNHFDILRRDIVRLNDGINESNLEFLGMEVNKSFKFKNHQSRVIRSVRDFGFSIEYHNRTDFYKIEIQIYKFINALILHFSVGVDCIPINNVKYG